MTRRARAVIARARTLKTILCTATSAMWPFCEGDLALNLPGAPRRGTGRTLPHSFTGRLANAIGLIANAEYGDLGRHSRSK